MFTLSFFSLRKFFSGLGLGVSWLLIFAIRINLSFWFSSSSILKPFAQNWLKSSGTSLSLPLGVSSLLSGTLKSTRLFSRFWLFSFSCSCSCRVSFNIYFMFGIGGGALLFCHNVSICSGICCCFSVTELILFSSFCSICNIRSSINFCTVFLSVFSFSCCSVNCLCMQSNLLPISLISSGPFLRSFLPFSSQSLHNQIGPEVFCRHLRTVGAMPEHSPAWYQQPHLKQETVPSLHSRLQVPHGYFVDWVLSLSPILKEYKEYKEYNTFPTS